MKDRTAFIVILLTFVAAYYTPFGSARVEAAIMEGFYMLQEYAREHVLTCLVPTFFIAGSGG